MRPRRPRYQQSFKKPKWLGRALTGLWWVLLIALIFLVEPERLKNVAFSGLYLPFVLLLFLGVSGTMYLIRKRFWPSLIWAIGISLFVILRLYGWGNVINLAMIGLSLLLLEIYWRKTAQVEANPPLDN